MSTELDLDLSALVGEMEALVCEHSQHGLARVDHTDEAASHYLRFNCPECGYMTDVYAACPGFVAMVRGDNLGHCRGCEASLPSSECITILGPVTK
jgi:ribosomal protein S27E